MKRILPLVILMVAFALRLYLLAESNIWYDEGLAVWAARQSLSAIAAWTSADVHPPLYFWLLHGWRGMVGESEFAIRWLSVAFGVLAVAVCYPLTRTLFRPQKSHRLPLLALGAMGLLALSRFHIWWSQEARMYILGALLVALSLYFTVKLRERVVPRHSIGYLLVTIAALYTLYLLAFLLVIEGLYWLVTLPRSRAAWRSLVIWGTLQGITLAAFAPWLLYALPRMQQWSVQVPFDGGQFARLYTTLLTLGISTHIETVAGWVLLWMGLVIVGVGVMGWRAPSYRHGIWLLALALVIPPLIVWGATTFPRAFGYSPKPEARYFVPYAPAFAILAAVAGAALIGAWRERVASLSSIASRYQWRVAIGGIGIALLLVGVVGLQGWTLQSYYGERLSTDEYRSITSTMRAYWRDGDGVLLHSDQPWPVFTYYWEGGWDGVTYTQEVQPNGTLNAVYPVWESHDAIWLVVNEDAQRIDPQGQVIGWLESKALVTEQWRFGSKRLLLFVRSPERVMGVGYIAPMAFNRWEQPLSRVRAGTQLSFFYSDLISLLPTTVTLSLGAPTAPITSHTLVIEEEELQRLQFDLLIPPDTPPATYPLFIQQNDAVEQISTLTILPPLGRTDAVATTLPPTAIPVAIALGNPLLIQLQGYEGELPSLQAGDTLPLTLYWQAAQPIPLSYKVFVHLSAADEEIWAQSDSEPATGSRPTTGWQVGELIVDSHTLTLDPATPPGRYTVWVGIYDPATGVRLPLPQGMDRIRLMEIEVAGR